MALHKKTREKLHNLYDNESYEDRYRRSFAITIIMINEFCSLSEAKELLQNWELGVA